MIRLGPLFLAVAVIAVPEPPRTTSRGNGIAAVGNRVDTGKPGTCAAASRDVPAVSTLPLTQRETPGHRHAATSYEGEAHDGWPT